MTPAPQTLTVVGAGYANALPAGGDSLGYSLETAQDLLRTASIDGLDEAVVVSTGHRTECYLVARRELDVERAWAGHVRARRPDVLAGHRDWPLRLRDADAVRHLCRLACGLDPDAAAASDVGASIKQALACATEAGTLGPILDRTFQQAFAARKATLPGAGRSRTNRTPAMLEASVEDAVERWRRWRWARPGETLLRQMFEHEHTSRAALVEAIIAAGFAGRRDELDYLIRRAWHSALRAHARGLRSWLQEDGFIARRAHQ